MGEEEVEVEHAATAPALYSTEAVHGYFTNNLSHRPQVFSKKGASLPVNKAV
jgi:hypothetical protein